MYTWFSNIEQLCVCVYFHPCGQPELGTYLFGLAQEGLSLVCGEVGVCAHQLQTAGEVGGRHAKQTV